MKDFIKNVGATIVGIFLFGIIVGIFGVMSLVGMVASGQATKNVKENSVLVLKLQGDLQEQAQDDVLGQLTGNTFNTLGMDAISSAIKKAKANKDIKGIYLETGILAPVVCSATFLPCCRLPNLALARRSPNRSISRSPRTIQTVSAGSCAILQKCIA